ncbi:hypothetical protein IQ07DRAFT_260739 [Pyrenochaeta sp. DS3sAY3a]|nr:hypothetical protein IQ07DRAFT_260739 [Pyrenochaeta sp. DS3sAY3a]
MREWQIKESADLVASRHGPWCRRGSRGGCGRRYSASSSSTCWRLLHVICRLSSRKAAPDSEKKLTTTKRVEADFQRRRDEGDTLARRLQENFPEPVQFTEVFSMCSNRHSHERTDWKKAASSSSCRVESKTSPTISSLLLSPIRLQAFLPQLVQFSAPRTLHLERQARRPHSKQPKSPSLPQGPHIHSPLPTSAPLAYASSAPQNGDVEEPWSTLVSTFLYFDGSLRSTRDFDVRCWNLRKY